jgi:serine/threonine protein kinase
MLPLLTEYSDALVDAFYRTCPKYQVVTRPDGTPYFVAGAFGCVFKATDPTNNRLLAIKCFTKHVNNKQQRLEAVATYLNQQKTPYTLHYRYLPNELWVGGAERADYYPILLMEWVEGETLGQAVQKAAQQGNKARLQQLADNFTDLALWLLAQPIAHTDLKHDNILVKPNNSLVLIDYDGMFVPALANYPRRKQRRRGVPTPTTPTKRLQPTLRRFFDSPNCRRPIWFSPTTHPIQPIRQPRQPTV